MMAGATVSSPKVSPRRPNGLLEGDNHRGAGRAFGRLVIIGRTFNAGQTPRTTAVRDSPTTGSLRVLSRKRRRGLARNGPLGAAIGNSGWVSAPSAGPPVIYGSFAQR